MQRQFRGMPEFNPSGRFSRGPRGGQQSPPADPAGDALPTGTPASPAAPNTSGAPASSPSQTGNPPAGSVDLSKLVQNLQKLNIASESKRPQVKTLGEALREYFGDQAQIDVGDKTIKITTQQGERQLEVYTRHSKGNTRAYLGLRVDKNRIRSIGQLLRYGDEYYINADLLKKIDNTPKPTQKKDDSQKPTDDKKPKKTLPKSVLYGAGLLATAGGIAGLSRFLGGGEDDDDKKKAQLGGSGGTGPLGTEVREEIHLKPPSSELKKAEDEQKPPGGGPAPAGGGPVVPAAGPPPVTVTEQPRQEIVVQAPPPKVVQEIASGEAPVQTRRKGNETVVKAGTSDGVFTLNISADKTLILKDKEVVGEFPTSEIIRAVGQMADGKTEKEIKRSGEFDDLLKNPWFLVAIALALVAFTRRGGRE